LPQVIFSLLEIGGRDLNREYGKAFKRVLLSLQQQYLPALKEYIKPESRPSMFDEPQNKLTYLDVDEEDAAKIRSG